MSETLSIRLSRIERELKDVRISATRFKEIFQELIVCLTIAQRQSTDATDPEYTTAGVNTLFIYFYGGGLFHEIKDAAEREAMLRACRAFTTDAVLAEMIGMRPFESTAAEILARAGFRREAESLFTKKQRKCLELECQEGSRSVIRGFVADVIFGDMFQYLSSNEALAWYTATQMVSSNQRFLSWEDWLERFKIIASILEMVPSEETIGFNRTLHSGKPKRLWKALFSWVRTCGIQQIDLCDDPAPDDTDH